MIGGPNHGRGREGRQPPAKRSGAKNRKGVAKRRSGMSFRPAAGNRSGPGLDTLKGTKAEERRLGFRLRAARRKSQTPASEDRPAGTVGQSIDGRHQKPMPARQDRPRR